jgi:hypothetical protein
LVVLLLHERMNTPFKIHLLLLFCLFGLNGISQDTEKYFFNRGNIAKLAANVTKDMSSEEEKVLAIHEWITHQLKWKNSKSYETSYKTAKKAVFKRKGPASSYVMLFDEMCKFAKIECEIVRGNVSPEYSDNYDPKAYEISCHSWNAVKINGIWFVLDVAFDAGCMKKKKHLLKKFMEKNISIPYPGGVKRFYFIKKKLKFVHKPSRDYYLKNQEMMATHFPLMPMWQLSKDTISSNIYRKKLWERKAHINSSSGEHEYDYNKEIDDYVFSVHPDLVEGTDGNQHNDTNFVALANGEVNFVNKSISLFKQKPIYDEDLVTNRLIEIDSLFSKLNEANSHIKNAIQIEKKIYASNIKVHKTRNKTVTSENRKRQSKLSVIQNKTVQLSKEFKNENKQIHEKSSAHQHKINKYEEWTPNFKETKPVSDKVYNQTIKTIEILFSKTLLIKAKMDSLENEFDEQLKEDFTSLKKNIIDSLIQETAWVKKSKLIVENYDHNLDSTYFSCRNSVNELHLHHLELADSLMKKFIWLQKQTLSNYKKELNTINQIKKEAYSLLKTVYSNGSIEKYITELNTLNEISLNRLSNLGEIMARVQERNNSFMAWFKEYRVNIKAALKEYLAETGKEKLRFKADIQYEKSLYKIQLHKIQKIGKSEKAVTTKLIQENKYNKDLLKEIKTENE